MIIKGYKLDFTHVVSHDVSTYRLTVNLPRPHLRLMINTHICTKCIVRHVFTMRITHCDILKAQKLSVLKRSCLYAQTSILRTYDCVCEGCIRCEGICCTANSVSALHALAACCSNSICQSLKAKDCVCARMKTT